ARQRETNGDPVTGNESDPTATLLSNELIFTEGKSKVIFLLRRSLLFQDSSYTLFKSETAFLNPLNVTDFPLKISPDFSIEK
ncbi:hypothetical protein, partial [Klebsiella pneumoniae]|uniref:hypothetical protein n=1 Tax=Klebsiella pneumoniae TaxID=573 RepID=UPI0027312FF9